MNKSVRAFLLALAAVVAVTITLWPEPSAAQSGNTVAVQGLHARITIRRDERGIPYIEAANDEDLYFAQGYVTASDRLWQMDLQRRTARGELSEIFGQASRKDSSSHVGLHEFRLGRGQLPAGSGA